MQDTVYLDVLFWENLCMDAWLLWIQGRLLRQESRWYLRGLGAAVGAFWACFWALWPPLRLGPTFFLVVPLMQLLAFGRRSPSSLLRQSLCFCALAFFLGGILSFLQQYLGAVGFFLWFAMALICGGLLVNAAALWRERRNLCEVRLVWRGQSLRLTGFRDSGNTLYFGREKRPVYVVSAASILAWREQSLDQLFWVPYRSVGKEAGVLPALIIDELWIDEAVCRTSPVIAISRYSVSSSGQYQVLLHSQEALP